MKFEPNQIATVIRCETAHCFAIGQKVKILREYEDVADAYWCRKIWMGITYGTLQTLLESELGKA